MDKSKLKTWLLGALLGAALLLPARSSWADCFECFCATADGKIACTSDMNLATAFCTKANTPNCDGFGGISTTACDSLPFSNCDFLIAPPKQPAPALGGWQLALVTLLLAGAGWRLARRRTT